MKQYEVIGAFASVNVGRVLVTQEQFRERRHALNPTGSFLPADEETDQEMILADLVQPTGFKRGEVFGYDGEVSKILFRELSEIQDVTLEVQEAEDGEDEGESIDLATIKLESLDRDELYDLAKRLELKPHYKAGKEKLIEMLEAFKAEQE